MSSIRKLTIEELDHFIRIDTNAYPGVVTHSPEVQMKLKQQIQNTQLHDPQADYYGLFRNEKVVGGMRIHHFTMNFCSQLIEVGGVGSIAVDLLHKKEGVAKELIQYFISYFRERRVPIVMLYPFRLDFYKRMGFGYGTKMNQFKINPASFLKNLGNKEVQYLTEEDKKDVLDCYNRYAEIQHGMCLRTDSEADTLFKNPNVLYVGLKKDNKIEGYLSFSFKKKSDTNFLLNDLIVKEFIYETSEAKQQLVGFLHNQFDQINRVIVNTQDEFFHYSITDPTNGSNHLIPSCYHETHTTGLGIMYRIIDVAGLFETLNNHNFNDISYSVKITVEDSFVPENSGSVVVDFEQGYAQIVEDSVPNAEIKLDVSDFSSLVMGAVNAKALYQQGLLTITKPEDIGIINRLFLTDDKPICMTAF
ncbi:enhanced intracellular survival protein Eis [Fredinandcohnia sp. 179-A 10B2 NHS]|uniref:GNAT family N-acetyltransferase n=1 Tax=Fredinandcohnia sp. 179-A 10B2 NHS TaxID=3235176 RepID=UPI0039A09AC9